MTHCFFRVCMDTWISKGLPLMTLPISYLDISSLGKWRHASKENIRTTRAFTRMDWLQYAGQREHLHACSLCRAVRKVRGMFDCASCLQKVCDTHVCACNYCDHLLCSRCAQRQACRSCWQTCGSC